MAAPRPLSAFLRSVDRTVVRLGPRDHLAAERLLRSRGQEWRHGELRAALASVLARSEEQWGQIARLYDDFHSGLEPGRPAPPPVDRDEPVRLEVLGPPTRGELRAARLRAGWARWVEKARNAPRGLWVAGVAIALMVGITAVVTLLPPLETQAPAGGSSAEPGVENLPEFFLERVEPEREMTIPLALEPPREPLRSTLVMAALAFSLALFGVRLASLPAVVAEARRRQVAERNTFTDSRRRELEEQKAAEGRALELRYRLDEHLPVSRQAVLDSAELLGRLFRQEHGVDLDAGRTLERTVEAAGRFTPVLEPRHIRQELLVLVDVEEGCHPWLPGFERLLGAWAAQGVVLRRWDFHMSPASLADAETREPVPLDELARRTEGLPLILFSRQLDPGARRGEAAWPRELAAWPRRVWLDPDPRRRRDLPAPRRRVTARLERQGLRRYQLTDAGVVALARCLAGGEEAAVRSPEEPLPALPAPEAATPLAEALRLWALAAALVPDPTWDQLEAIRRHFSELDRELPDRRSLQLLLGWVERETGGRAEKGGGKGLEIPEAQQHAWLLKQRRLESDVPPDQRFENRARELLLAQLEATRPEDELDREWWRFKRAMHRAVLAPEKARELLAWVHESPVAHEAVRWVKGELQRQREGEGGPRFAKADVEVLEALAAGARGVPVRALTGGFGRLWVRALALAVPVAGLVGVALGGWGTDAALRLFHRPVTEQRPVLIPGTFRLVEAEASVQPEMVRIPGGAFEMGSEEGDRDELPVHQVQVAPFAISKTEVTVVQYRRCVEAGYCDVPRQEGSCNWEVGGRDQHPINCVSWTDAKRYADWIGARLPTEAEWEYAARAGCPAEYCDRTGEPTTLDEVGWYSGNSGGGTHPVGQLEPNPWGLHDMIGNVWEWVEDDWHGSYEDAPADGRAWVADPRASLRVIRGGSWDFDPRLARVAFRGWLQPSLRGAFLGFRVARSLPSAP